MISNLLEEARTYGFKGYNVKELIEYGFNTQSDRILFLSVKMLAFYVVFNKPSNELRKYALTLRAFCWQEYKHIWKRHNFLLTI